MDVVKHNRRAWDQEVRNGNDWTIPVDAKRVARARRGDWTIVLTPNKPVPKAWFPDLRGHRGAVPRVRAAGSRARSWRRPAPR